MNRVPVRNPRRDVIVVMDAKSCVKIVNIPGNHEIDVGKNDL